MHVVPDVTGDSGCCVLSGSANDPYGFVATDYVVEPGRFWGRAHIAGSTVIELGQALGMFHPDTVELIEVERDTYKERVAELERELVGLEAENEALSGAVRRAAPKKRKAPVRAAA